MDTPISRAEHNEFVKRMEDEHHRLHHRIEVVEDKVEEIGDLTASVARLASSMEQMLKEQQKQGDRLDALEGRDGELWRKATGYVLTTIISIIVGFVFAKLGIM